jgi:hypothetical protein
VLRSRSVGKAGVRVKLFILIALACISGCSWFHARKPPAPIPPELIVTGAPTGSVLFIDGVQAGAPTESNKRTHDLVVTAGTHTVEVRMGDHTVYRENAFVGPGDKRVIMVLSGVSRE